MPSDAVEDVLLFPYTVLLLLPGVLTTTGAPMVLLEHVDAVDPYDAGTMAVETVVAAADAAATVKPADIAKLAVFDGHLTQAA